MPFKLFQECRTWTVSASACVYLTSARQTWSQRDPFYFETQCRSLDCLR